MSRRGGAGQNPPYDIDLEGFFYQFPAGLFQALKVGHCHMLIECSLTFPCFVKIETSLWVRRAGRHHRKIQSPLTRLSRALRGAGPGGLPIAPHTTAEVLPCAVVLSLLWPRRADEASGLAFNAREFGECKDESN